jgi:hypothetical protein
MHIKRIPKFLVNYLISIPVVFRYNHFHRVCALLSALCAYTGKCTTVGMARFLPKTISRWSLSRLLAEARTEIDKLFVALSRRVLWALQRPDEDLVLIIDSSLRARFGSQIWAVAKRRANEHGRWLNHAHQIVALIGYADGVRIPLDWRLHLKKKDLRKGQPYKSTNELALEMLEAFQPPPCRQVIVLADAGFSSNELLRKIRQRGWHFLFAMAKTRRLQSGKSLKDMARCTNHRHYRKVFVHLPSGRRRAFWLIGRQDAIRGVGKVALVHSKMRLTDAPERVKVIATSLQCLSARDIVTLYRLRWHVEVFFKELKQLCGFGQMQVRGEEAVRASYAASFAAYATLAALSQRHSDPQEQWSLWQAKLLFQFLIARDQVIYDNQKSRRRARRELMMAA